jgi:ABC-type amino acid transport substrate-binding protein
MNLCPGTTLPRPIPGIAIAAAALALTTACATAPPGGTHPAGSPAVAEAHGGAASGPVTGTSFAEARRSGVADLVFFHVPSSGFAYAGGDGRLTGVTVELLRDFAAFVAERHAIDVRVTWLEEPRWADFYGYVRDSRGGVFGIGNVTITEARRDQIAFSPPYLNNIAVLVTHERIPELRSLDHIGEAFRGLTALPYPGTLHEARLTALAERWLPGMRTRPVASNDELVSLLASDGAHFGYIDVYNFWRARQAGQPLRRHPVGDDASETFGVIMPHGSDWAPVMEEFFRTDGGYAESARFRTLLRTHLGDELASLLGG